MHLATTWESAKALQSNCSVHEAIKSTEPHADDTCRFKAIPKCPIPKHNRRESLPCRTAPRSLKQPKSTGQNRALHISKRSGASQKKAQQHAPNLNQNSHIPRLFLPYSYFKQQGDFSYPGQVFPIQPLPEGTDTGPSAILIPSNQTAPIASSAFLGCFQTSLTCWGLGIPRKENTTLTMQIPLFFSPGKASLQVLCSLL